MCTLDRRADIPVSPGSMLDFETRDLVIKRQTRLVVGPSVGAMTIRAKSVTLEPGASLVAVGGQITVTTTGAIRISASGGNFARIDVSANGGGGSILLNAGGLADISGVLSAKAAAGDGGNIDVTALSSIGLSGELNATGRATGAGGTISLKTTGGPIAINGLVDVSGTEGGGGDIDIEATSDITTNVKLDASGGGSGGNGGTITLLSSAGGIQMSAGLDGRGAPAGAVDFGGTGAVVEITAAQNIAIDGQFILSGGAPDGEGGSVSVDTDGNLIFNASILAQGNGVDGCGSPDGISLNARGDITLNDIDVSGGTCGGGSIEVSSINGAVSLAGPFQVLADGTGPLGFAGVISVRGEALQIDGDMSAGSDQFIGGDIMLEACGDLTVGATSVVSAAGEAGTTELLARGTLRAAGKLFSGVPPLGSQGSNTIEYRTTAPILDASHILPPAALKDNLDSCDLCGNLVVDAGEQCDDGNRINDAVCDANCTFPGCGNGIVDPGEACDDGNTMSCDGCNATCTRVDNVCGDNTTECGEACDDGNTDSCDGCKGDCSRHDDVCGDNIIECAEECDGDTQNAGLHCSQTCKLEAPPHCGDTVVQANEGEQCDPPTPDVCSHLCQFVICGDNIVEDGEACDNGNTDSCDGCSADCKQIDNVCGDGHKDCGELCDDGNLVDGDGCDSNCTPTGCGNGIVTAGEACDDGNTTSCDGCAGNCARGDDVCGDGIVECSEDCEPPSGPGCDDQCHQTMACTVAADCGGICTAGCVAGVCSTAARLDCNDNNPCTTDTCATGACQHTTAANGTPCDDGNACTTESCQSGQCAANTATCDDGDFCTDDSCAPASGCAHVRRTGIAGVTCQLDAIDDSLTRGAALVKASTRQKIMNASHRARTALNAANAAAGTRKAAKKLKMAKKALSVLAKTVKMARKKHQLTEPLGGLVDGFVSGALGALGSVHI